LTSGLENLAKPIPFVPHLRESYRVIVVRHPLERLLSAYIYIFRYEVPGKKGFGYTYIKVYMLWYNVKLQGG
jgi:hypothetical protein